MNLDDIWTRFLTAFRQADFIMSIEKSWLPASHSFIS